MSYEEMIKAIHDSKAIWVVVRFAVDNFYNMKITKKQALQLILATSEEEFQAEYYKRSRNLYIG